MTRATQAGPKGAQQGSSSSTPAEVFAVGTRWFVNDPWPNIGFSMFLLWRSLWGMPLLDGQVELQGRAPLGVAERWLPTEGLATAGRKTS